MKYLNDIDFWITTDNDDLWLFDKLILSKKLGYTCGPAGLPPPIENNFIVRPITNIRMMGRNATIKYLTPIEYDIPDGYFWCEMFKGRHLSFDYHYGQQVLAVEGFRKNERLDRFSRWEKVEDQYELPGILKPIALKYEWLNVETIDNKVIEVHLRYNDDFVNHNANVIVPIWKEDFYPSECGDRIGFILER
jgi:hypothetical protein